MEPSVVRQMIVDNYGGVRIDGTNATIIGNRQGEFIADRNNIARVWMDHAFWPFVTTQLYMDQTGDMNVLFEKIPYFKDLQTKRGTAHDEKWSSAYGENQKTESGEIYYGTVLEHILLENLCAFYDVGEHNEMKLHGADWNDAMDMAWENGESVAFTCAYAGNMKNIAEYLRKLQEKEMFDRIEVAEEMEILFTGDRELYESPEKKQQLLRQYTEKCAHDISGNTYGNVKAFAGDKEIGLDFTKDVVESGDTVTTKVKISASSYLSVDWEKTFNKADNTFENTVNANIVGADTYVFNYKGAYKDINKGVGYTVAIDSFELKAANQTLCNGSIDTTIDTSKISVQEMDASKKVYDLATMTEDDLQTFGEESQKLMDAWVERLSDNTAFVNLINALNSLFGTNSDLLNQVEEDIDEDTATYSDADFSDDNTDEITLDNASVMTYDGSAKYKIKGCIDGFNFEYANEYGVMFETEQVSTIQYGLYTAESASDALDSVYYDMSNIDSYEILDTQLNQTAKVEDKDVLYNVQTYNAFQMKCMDVTAVIEVEPGVFLSMEASIYLDDDDYTVEQLLQALESKYYEKIQ